MSLKDDIVTNLELLKYPQVECLVSNGAFRNLTLSEYSKLVNWITLELRPILRLENIVNEMTCDSDEDCFRIELSSLLNELKSFYTIHSLNDELGRLSLLHSLIGELLAARILYVTNPKEYGPKMQIEINESKTAKELKAAIITLGVGKPPSNFTAFQLFKKIKQKLEKNLSSNGTLSKPLILKDTELTNSQWSALELINKRLYEDFKIRRSTLITRCDCTIASFKWNEGKENSDSFSEKIDQVYETLRIHLNPNPNVNMAQALATRKGDCTELLNSVVSKSHQTCDIVAPKTTGMANIGKQQRLSLHKVIIGHVPDRGGRPNEQAPPIKETFEQQQHQRQQFTNRGGHQSSSSGYRGHDNRNSHARDRGVYERRGNERMHDRQSNEGSRYENFSDRSGYEPNNSYQGNQMYSQYYHQKSYSESDNYDRRQKDNFRDNRGRDRNDRFYNRGGRGGHQNRVQGAGWSNYRY